MGIVKWWGPGEEKLRGQETFYECLCCGPRCKFPDSPRTLLKVKLGRKKGVVQPHWMIGQSRQFLTSVCYFWLRIHIFCQTHLADFLSLRYDWKKWIPWVLKRALGQLGAICIYPTVHWSRSSDSQHLGPRAVSRWDPLVPNPCRGEETTSANYSVTDPVHLWNSLRSKVTNWSISEWGLMDLEWFA